MRPVLLAATALLLLALATLARGGSTPALATFHEMRIYGVMGGAGGSGSEQFIELREAVGGQTEVQNAQLCFFDSGGFPWARFVFPHHVTGGADDSSILIGSAAMEADWNAAGAPLDFTFGASNTTAINPSADVSAPIPQPAGAIVYESTADSSCGSPQSGAIDMIAYGTGYNGAAFFGSAFMHDLPLNAGGIQLKTAPVTFPPHDNSTEYAVVQCIVARNNAGQQGTVGGGNCAPPGNLQGDADCDHDVDIGDGLAVLRAFGGIGTIGCPDAANVNCEGGSDPIDTLLITKFAAGISFAAAGCTPIGQPLQR